MGRRGPAPKPTTLKRLEGNPGKRALNRREPKPRAAQKGEIKAPKHLGTIARAEWDRVVPELQRLGLYTDVDHAALEAYCASYERWIQAEAILKDEGLTFTTEKGYIGQRPEVGIVQSSLQLIKTFCSEFGLTPSARARMTLPEPKQPDDPFETFLTNGRA
jgi:P27 family predicted phage terminase small subunit